MRGTVNLLRLGATLPMGFRLLTIGLMILVQLGCMSIADKQALESQVARPATLQVGYGEAPFFIPNVGQTNSKVRYYAQGSGYGLYFTSEEAVFVFVPQATRGDQREIITPVCSRNGASPKRERATRGVTLALRFVSANPDTKIEARQEKTAKVNYLTGNDIAKWHTGLPTYREIVYRELWPGVDLIFRGTSGHLKYEFVLQPGANPKAIRLAYQGADALSLDDAGNLLIKTPLGVMTDQRPWSYQQVAGKQVTVESRFQIERRPGGESVYGFNIDSEHDPRYPLIIDPGLAYSTFLGGNRSDIPFGIAVDVSGNAYVTGITSSTNFPTTVGAFDRSFNGFCDVFVVKLDPSGSQLLYATFLGGSGCDQGNSIALDTFGNAYVGGSTPSINFPTTDGAFARARAGSTDGFVIKLDPNGFPLYSTYLGGSNFDNVSGVAVDADGKVYVSGTTSSTNFPTTPGAFDRTRAGSTDAFVAKLDPSATGVASLIYSTYLGGSAGEGFQIGIAVDPSGHAYVKGRTDSPDFPTTENAFDRTYNSPPGDFFRGGDIFVTKLDPSGSRLLYSTFLGGRGTEEPPGGIALDTLGYVYVTGQVISTNCCTPPFLSDFPTTPGAFDRTFNGFTDVFVAKLDTTSAGTASLVYSTFLGGTGTDFINLSSTRAIAVDVQGNAYVVGGTVTLDFPITPGAFAGPRGSFGGDAFVAKLDATGSRLLYGTYLGGACGDFGFNSDDALGLAIDDAGNAYVVGHTFASTFPTTAGAFDRTINSIGFQGGDSFVSKLATTPQGQSEVVIHDVSRLVTAGALSQGQGNALIAPLQSAIQQLDQGARGAAINQLESFINQVIALVRRETLSPAQGDPLIDDTREIINFIKYLG